MTAEPTAAPPRTVPDFEKARIVWRTHAGSNGIWRIVATLARADATGTRFVLAPPVMAGDVYGKGRLPRDPPYCYQLAASPDRHVVWRDYGMGSRDSAGPNAETFSRLAITLPELELTALDLRDLSDPAILERPLVARVEVEDRHGVAWRLAFPVLHVNHRGLPSQRPEFQVETGPVLIPESLIEPGTGASNGGLALAYVFFNRPDRIEVALLAASAPSAASRRGYDGYGRFDRVRVDVLY